MKAISWLDQSFLARKSVFYVGGGYAEKDGRHFMCNQMFVEAYEPEELRHPYPLILFHGAGQTNVNWLITPDGRWAGPITLSPRATGSFWQSSRPEGAQPGTRPSTDLPPSTL